MVLAQAACLALGLGVDHRLVTAFARHEKGAALAKTQRPGEAGSTGTSSAPAGRAAAHSMGPSATAINVMTFIWIASVQAVIAYLFATRAHEETSRRQTEAERISLQRHSDLLRTRDAVIFGLAGLADSRDSETGKHLERIATYSTRLASALARRPGYRGRITASFVRLIGLSSALHDIGKVGIRDAILLKPGRFKKHERLTMQAHAAIGGQCIRNIEARLGNSNFLQMAREIAMCHHERWDGGGYPAQLAGEKIPLAARIVALADVYDALSTRRVYKEPYAHEKCVRIIRKGAGAAFDPAIVAVFLEIEAEFGEIARQYRDTAESLGAAPGENTADQPPGVSEEGVLSAILELVRPGADDRAGVPVSPVNSLEVKYVS
jgi:HD-GYP domain-containing protein (c-di-GMP phosphodiesterase class II)